MGSPKAHGIVRTLSKPNYFRFSNCQTFINDLNNFYCRFDTVEGKTECDEICNNLSVEESIVIKETDVMASLRKLKSNKTTGPDGLKARLLKDCAPQLKGVFTRLFQFLLDKSAVPKLWKYSVIQPVAKKPGASMPNDYRPIAITSILCKTMERVLASYLTSCVASTLDPLQFAYKSNRGTDDAVLTLLNTVTKHLTNPKGYARILFVDFSSAFNSMKTHLLLKRLVDLNINQGLVLWIRNFYLVVHKESVLEG